jgi:DNA-binding NarL/FixJ family response regulator
MPEESLRVLIVDDDAIVRDWVRASLAESEFAVAGEAATPDEALRLGAARRFDLILVDYRLAGRSGLDLIRELRSTGNETPAILITAAAELGLNERAREAGAQGTAVKSSSRDDLLAALRAAAGGVPRFAGLHPERPPGERPLAPRERDVLRLVALGRTNPEIAAELGLGAETVKTLLERVYDKLGVRRRAEAAVVAQRRGLL